MIESHINAGNPKKISLCIKDWRNNAYHHYIFSHQLIHIRIHNIRFSRFFYLHIIFFCIIVKCILVFFEYISSLFFIGVYDRFICNLSVMDTIRFSIFIRNRILLKISKRCRIPSTAFQKAHKRSINRLSLLLWVQLRNISERSGKTDYFSISVFNIICN